MHYILPSFYGFLFSYGFLKYIYEDIVKEGVGYILMEFMPNFSPDKLATGGIDKGIDLDTC